MFLYRLLRERNIGSNRITVITDYPAEKGCGSAYVLNAYAAQVRKCRNRHASSALLVHIDADQLTVDRRAQELAERLSADGQAKRRADEPIAHAIPKHCIEAWIGYLMDMPADEEKPKEGWPRFTSEQWKHAAENLATMLRSAEPWPADAPDSLTRARPEFQRVL
jgi:hypothetical protein